MEQIPPISTSDRYKDAIERAIDSKIKRLEARSKSRSGGNGDLAEERARAVRVNRQRAEMLLAKARGELIEKRAVKMQAAFLLSAFRQRVLAEPASLAGRLVASGFLEERRRTEVQEIIKNDLCAMLKELADLPRRLGDPDWVSKIDPDLRRQAEGGAEEAAAGGFVAHPSELKRRAVRAEHRRQQKAETMRSLREKGRIMN